MRDLKKSTSSLETRRIRKILNEEARLGISTNSESETEEVDLQKDLYPLGHYINNREEMIEQMFSIIKGARLKKMLPPILKDMPVDELKADCLIHLLGMSKKRIRAILDGKEINSSSDSESHSDSSTTPSKKQKIELKPFVIKQEGCSDISDNSEEVVLVDPDLDFLNVTYADKKKLESNEEKKKSKRKLKRSDLDKKHKRTKIKVVEQASESDEVHHIDSSVESISENEAETEAPKEGKTLLEILELEMRARAIRALLKNNDTQESPEKAVDGQSQNAKNSKEKVNKQLRDRSAEKVTPAKNFRKKKRKSDDVIVIAPKVVTIDLTDENEQAGIKINKDDNREENAPISSQNNNLDNNCQEDLVNDSHLIDNEIEKSSVSEKTVPNEECSKSKERNISEVVAPCSVEKTSKNNLDQINQSEHGKSSWAQRWLESKEVKRVVSTSKICGNIRKKIKNAKLAKQQKQSQNEPNEPAPALQQEMEGSVVEYELLLKSKRTDSDVDGATDKDTQASGSSANQEPTSSEADFIEAPTADQVQDVSSTKIENPSPSTEQDTGSDLQSSEGTTTGSKVNSRELKIDVNQSDKLDLQNKFISTDEVVDTNRDGHCSDDGVVEISKPKCLNKNENNLENVNENICSIIGTKANKTLTNHPRDNNKSGPEEDNNKSPQDTLLNEIPEMESHKAKLDDSYKCCNSLPNENYAKDSQSDTLLSEQPIMNSKTSEDGVDLNKKNNKANSEKNLQLESKDNQSKKKLLEVSESEKSVIPVSVNSTKVTQEPNEQEALEINITEEDRDIEDITEGNSETNKLKNVKHDIIVID